jgi:membrane associated rhomboid family serine protease
MHAPALAPEPSALPAAATLFPEDSEAVGIYPTHLAAFERSLVILAMGQTCWIVPAPDGHHLRVAPALVDLTRRQIGYYDRECLGWPPRPALDTAPARKHLPLSPLLWVIGIFLVFAAQLQRPALTDAWLLDPHRVFTFGEWWRTATALWLHADLSHLVSNAGGGFLVFSAVIATFGFAPGWALLAASSITGNLAAAAAHSGDDYRSLGASTAVFAGLGLLTGRAVRVLLRSGHPRRRAVLTPLASGLVVLGLYGAGGIHIDVLAHATGFTSGLLLSLAAGLPDATTHPSTNGSIR